MTPAERANRLLGLYDLHARVRGEIAALEAEIANEYAALRRAKAAAAKAGVKTSHRVVALCGTDSGYFRHRRQLHEPPCDACRLAHAAAEKARATARRLAAEGAA